MPVKTKILVNYYTNGDAVGQDPNCDSFGNTSVRVPAEPPGCSCLPSTGPPCAPASGLPPVSLGLLRLGSHSSYVHPHERLSRDSHTSP